MNITKQNENFTLTDATDVFEISGNLTHEASGAVSVHFTVNAVGGDYLGDCSYVKYSEGNNVHFSVSCPEDRREAITVYADTVIDSVLEYIKPAI